MRNFFVGSTGFIRSTGLTVLTVLTVLMGLTAVLLTSCNDPVKTDPTVTPIEYQVNLGEGINIHDIAVVSETKAYISCLQSKDLIVFDPKAGKKLSTIDLSRFNAYAGTDSAEAYPFMSSLAVYDNHLYVACQRLNSLFEPADTSLIAVIDINTDEIIASIKLQKKNPASMSVFDNKLLVSSSGDWRDAAASTSGIEMIDVTSNENLGVIADGIAFGGSLGDIVFVSQSKAYAAVMNASWTTDVIVFNPATKTIGAKISGISDGYGGIAYDGTKLYIGDRGFGAAGVAVVNPNTNTVEQTITTEMPPSSLAIIAGRGVAATTVAADYSAANFEIISTEDYSVHTNIIPGLFTDNVVRAFGSDVYILERYGKDNVIKYNANEK